MRWSHKLWSNRATPPKSPMQKTTKLCRSKKKRSSAPNNRSNFRNNNNCRSCSISESYNNSNNRGNKSCSSNKLRPKNKRRKFRNNN